MKVGSLCECVELHPSYPEFGIQKGVVYTVSSIYEFPCCNRIGLQFDEIDSGMGYSGSDHFREVQPPMDLEFIQELQQEKVLVNI